MLGSDKIWYIYLLILWRLWLAYIYFPDKHIIEKGYAVIISLGIEEFGSDFFLLEK
jgi:hypothetical protein